MVGSLSCEPRLTVMTLQPAVGSSAGRRPTGFGGSRRFGGGLGEGPAAAHLLPSRHRLPDSTPMQVLPARVSENREVDAERRLRADLSREAAGHIKQLRDTADYLRRDRASAERADALDEAASAFARLSQLRQIEVDNIRELWMALRQVREAIETLGPIGALPAAESIRDAKAVGDALAQAIATMAALLAKLPARRED